MKKMETAMNLFVPTGDQVMPLYDEVELPASVTSDQTKGDDSGAAGESVTAVHECSLRKNQKMNLYWRCVAGLHELGHTIARFPLCSANSTDDPPVVRQRSSIRSRGRFARFLGRRRVGQRRPEISEPIPIVDTDSDDDEAAMVDNVATSATSTVAAARPAKEAIVY